MSKNKQAGEINPAKAINRSAHRHYSLMSRISQGQDSAHLLMLIPQDHKALQRLIDQGLVLVVRRCPTRYWADGERLNEAQKLDKKRRLA